MNLRVRYIDLTPQEKAVICNGCGPKGGIIPVPEFRFTASCLHHDFNYWLGCKEIQRKKADLQFYKEMVKDANRANTANARRRHRRLARIYYLAVRLCGRFCFHYANEQRTRMDLQKAMDAANDVKRALR